MFKEIPVDLLLEAQRKFNATALPKLISTIIASKPKDDFSIKWELHVDDWGVECSVLLTDFGIFLIVSNMHGKFRTRLPEYC